MCKLTSRYPTYECDENDNHLHFCQDTDEVLLGDVAGRVHMVIGYKDLTEFLLWVNMIRGSAASLEGT